jgi:thioesterase domain-containing protein/acyl carrier protein
LIGKPIDQTEILILNEDREVQPKDSIGQIYIGGAGVARGYLNKPELTADRFIVNPFSGGKNARLFKTGDYGRYLQDGNIEYLGRIDEQVKVNGFRIELESVEVNIRNSGVVKHTVLLTRKNRIGFMQIIAYVTMQPGKNLQELWAHLTSKLPGYMLPTNITEVDSIPFTTNGKVDKESLLNLYWQNSQGNAFTAPRTSLEKVVYEIWQKLFTNTRLSIYDNFFDLGGTSLMALSMLSMIKKQTDTHLSFLLLNQYPTIESLAKLLAKPKMTDIPNTLFAINPLGTKTPVYLVNGGGLIEGGFFNLSDELDVNQPVYSFLSNGYDSKGNIFNCMEDVARSYVKEIIKENPKGPYSVAGYSLGGVLAFEMAKQLRSLGKEVKVLVMIDALTRDPELIKTQYNLITILNMIGFNIYLFKQNPVRAINYTVGTLKAVFKRLKSGKHIAPVDETPSEDLKEKDFDVFGIHVEAYRKYCIEPYDGNIVVFRARELTFYMEDFKYLGWKPFADKVKRISISGNHYSIFDNSNIKKFGKKLQEVLDEGF